MDFLGNILSGQDLVNKDYVDKAIPVVPTKLSGFTNDLGLGNLAYKSSLVASDIPDLSGTYIPKVGGRTSDLTIEGSGTAWLVFGNSSGTSFGSIGVNSSHEPTFWNGSGSYTLYHSGNFNPANYLPLTGGTISGMLKLNTSDTDEVGIELSVNGISKGWLGYAEVDYGTCLYNYACDKYLGIKDDGTPHYNGNTLIHSGNVGDYALPITGGTIEGHLTIGVDGSTTAQHLLRMYRMNGTTRNRLLAGILDDNSIELSYYSPTSGGYGRLVLGASTYKVGNSTLYDIIHSGNIGSYAFLKTATKLTSSDTLDADLIGLYSYQDGNNPTNSFGNNAALLSFKGTKANPTFQLAFAGNEGTIGYKVKTTSGTWQPWKTIAFTDSDITGSVLNSNGDLLLTYNDGLLLGYGSAAKSKNTIIYGDSVIMKYSPSRTTGFILNSSGNVTIGNSDLALTNYKLYVNGQTYFSGALSLNDVLTMPNAKQFRMRDTQNTPRNVLELTSDNELRIGYGTRPAAYNTKLLGYNIYFVTGSNITALTITNGYNVGIGTTSPAYKLDVAGTGRFTGALTVGAGATFNGDVRINGNLIVTGDSSSGGTGEGASVLHGPVSVNVPALLLLNGERNVTQATMDGYGLTQAVVANMLAGMYTKVTHTKDSGYKDVYSYDGNEDSTYITIFIRQGDSFDINTGMVLRYVRSSQTWQVSMNEI